MAHTKHSVKQRIQKVETQPLTTGKAPWVKKIQKMRRFWLGTRALCEIRKFQKLTWLLILKLVFQRLVKEILQKENVWYQIQVGAVLALHEAAETYLMRLFEDYNMCLQLCLRTYSSPEELGGSPESTLFCCYYHVIFLLYRSVL